MPGVPVLVVDDCSTDATDQSARAAGADVLPLPYHLGLGGCVQAGYRLAFELGYEYVIRVDGDGQHDPADIPRSLKALEREGCEMVIGSRFRQRHRRALRRAPRHLESVLPRRAAAHSGQTGARSDLRIRGREPHRAGLFSPQLSAGISGDRGAGGAAAQALPLRRKCPAACGRAGPAAASITAVKSLYYICARAAGRVRERAEVRRPPKKGISRRGNTMHRLLNVTTVLSLLLMAWCCSRCGARTSAWSIR